VGNLQKAEYYNNIYSVNKGYKVNYKKSEYYPLWKEVIRQLKELKIPIPLILELGCGTGQFANFLYDEMFREYIGLDFSQVAVDIANKMRHKKKMYTMYFLKGDVLLQETYPDSYNMILALELFEHTDDLRILTLLKKGTRIIFTVPTFNDPAHIRTFLNAQFAIERYSNFIKFNSVVQFGKYFIGEGVIL